MLSLKLFNAVLAAEQPAEAPARVVDTLPLGYVIAPSAAHLADQIVAYYGQEQLSGEQLNQTFHKSWERVQQATRSELLAHQLMHYFTTYGFAALGIETNYIYLPDEACEVPELRKVPVRVIHGLSADELAEQCLDLLRAGVALAEETLRDLFGLLEQLDRIPATTAGIRNREALVLFADKYMVYPDSPVDFLRYLVFKATGSTLLIKNPKTTQQIAESQLELSGPVAVYGAARCAEVFNRFKPLWLAFKKHEPNVAVVNLISRLSKTHHRPLPGDYLNAVTAQEDIDPAELEAALDKANAFRKIRLLYALNTRLNDADYLVYRIRNGKSYVEDIRADKERMGTWQQIKKSLGPEKSQMTAWQAAYEQVFQHLARHLDVAGRTFLMSKDVHLSLPATEKMFIGNMPYGTSITEAGAITVGIYWRNEWGASDLDLSALALGKIGWNASFRGDGVTYSGDITHAPDGATELLRFSSAVKTPHLVMVNVYNGGEEVGFKIIVGQAASISANYMFRPDELRAEVKTTTDQRQQVIGIVIPDGQSCRFVLADFGAGGGRVSSASNAAAFRLALHDQWKNAPTLRDLLLAAGARVVTDPATVTDIEHIDLRWEQLAKDSILKLFTT